MIDVTLTKKGNHHSLIVKDHAETRVCAGISALTLALCGWCRNNREDLIDLYIHIEAGNTEISFVGNCIATSVFEAIQIGIHQIAMGYPGEVSVHDFT